jgi:2'-5' RNA ligase
MKKRRRPQAAVSSSPSIVRPSTLNLASSPWRVFCAIEISEEVRTRLANHIQILRQTVPHANASWSRPENIHLTLKFFGDVDRGQNEKLSVAAARVAKEFTPFEIRVGETGTFPKQAQPRVLWVGVEDPSGNLASLQKQLENECAEEGFPKEGRAFRPHLTLARIRSPQGSRTLGEIHTKIGFAATEVVASELLLMRSELSSEGSKYTVISRHRLGAMRAGS